ncbi:MAG: hypothetical protein PF439_10670 [Helicobacteraceae bacterium]|nr:hypothetical protein [Helicobacteraceae bacterium]
MKSTIKYLSLVIVLIIIVIIALLFSPIVTKAFTQKALSHFLKVDANVTQARFSLLGFRTSGTLDKNDTFDLHLLPLSWNSAIVQLHYDGDVHTFSNVATVELPYAAAVLDARFTTENLLLELNATLLDGTLTGDISLENWDYRYQISNVDLASFRLQQRPPILNYATGTLSATGSGSIKAPYTVDFSLLSHDLQLEENATAVISAALEHPLPLTLEINGSINTDHLTSKLAIQSKLIDLDATALYYDFNQSLINANLQLDNHNDQIAPIKHATLDINGSIGKKDLNASFLLSVDDYQLQTKRVQYAFNSNDITLDYRLSSLKDKPFNLQGDHALFGDLSYANSKLSLKMNAQALESPILLTLKENQLHLISNNISLGALQEMVNLEVVARGHATVEADANLSSEPILWLAKATSKDLKLPLKFRKELGLNNDLAVTVSANSEKNGDIVVRPTVWSNVGVVAYTALRYRPAPQLLYFNLNAKKIKTTYYQVPKLNIKGSLNIEKGRLNKTTVTTPYEKAVVRELSYSDKGVTSHIDFVLTRLDRFGTFNPDYNLTGKTFLNYTPQKSAVAISSKEMGNISIESKEKVIKVSGKALPIEEIMRLTDQPIIMKGNLGYDIRYTPSSIKAELSSDKLSGYGDLNRSIRPFALDLSTSLKNRKDRYRGQATLNTGNEIFTISNVVADLSKKTLKSRYTLDIKALEKNTFILPKALKGPLHVHGDFKKDGSQYLTLYLQDFQLPQEWHKKLDHNATSHLETNASLQVSNDKGLINFDAEVTNTLLQLKLHKSTYNLKTGDFYLKGDLKTELWLKDTNISAAGKYQDNYLYLSDADVITAHQTANLHNLHFGFNDQNLTTEYQLRLTPYPHSPYHSAASLYGKVHTHPKLYATMESDSMGGEFSAYATETDLHLTAKNVSVTKLIAFSGQKLPILEGSLDSTININAASLLESNLSTISGRSDMNITGMVLEGVALDTSLQNHRDSQDLNLFEGTFSELPIIRSIISIPSDFTKKTAQSTHFGKIRLLTDIKDAMLHCTDCAIATDDNLIAIKGNINLSSQTFDNFYVGLLLPTNCAYFIQQIEGNLSRPQVQLAAAGFNVIGGATKSLIGNIGSVIDLGADIVKGTGAAVGEAASYVPVVGKETDRALTSITDLPKDISGAAMKCTPFYTGTVNHPKPISQSLFSREKDKIEKSRAERKEKRKESTVK